MFYNQQVETDFKEVISSISLKKFKNSKILVLGSNSFLASYLIGILSYANKNNDLRCKIDCFSKNNPHSLFKEIKKKYSKYINFYKIDLQNISKLKKKISKKNYDFIFHLATYGQPEKWFNNLHTTIILNTVLLEEIIKFAREKKSKLIYFSSADVYDEKKNQEVNYENSKLGFSNDPMRSVYSLSKIMGENICKFYKDQFNFKVYIARPGHTYGPGQTIYDRRFISQIMKRALLEKKVYIYNSGESIKTWGYISEVISMVLNIAQNGKAQIYNVVGNNFLSIKNLAKIIAKKENIAFEIKNKKKINFTSKDFQCVKISAKKYNKEFKKKLTKISISDGIDRYINWSKNSLRFNK